MEWVEKLHDKIVAIDTAPLIFFIEKHPKYADTLRPFFEAVHAGKLQVVTSTITLLEVLVHPLRHEDEQLAYQYNDILLSSLHVKTVPVTFSTAQRAAELRAMHGLKTPDAIQLAIAIDYNAAVFLTNDRDFRNVDEIEVLKVGDIVP